MSKNELISPDYLFEVSWEVCNKIGGIYTVISTKAAVIKEELKDNYILIGPDVWKETHKNPYFIEDPVLFRTWREEASSKGLKFRVGRFKGAADSIAILVDFTPYFAQKDEIFAHFWEKYGLDSITGQWDYTEPALFGYAAGKIIEHFYEYNLSSHDRIVAQFHEWMTGSGVLYLKDKVPQIGTVFTTHATVLGRSIAGNGWNLYNDLQLFNPDQIARDLGVMAKYSLEKNAANQADVFTTVSEVTALECRKFFGRDVDFVTPNGFDMNFVPENEDYNHRKAHAKQVLHAVAESTLNQPISLDAFHVATSGRYEFRNKGIDVFIDGISKLANTYAGKREIIAWIMVPGHQSGPKAEVLERLQNRDFGTKLEFEFLTHGLYEPEHDAVLRQVRHNKFCNKAEGKVKLIFVPAFLDETDGIFNLNYYDILIGFDLTIFPSYYEPWGYTPLESLAFHVPTFTTSLSGFGMWIKDNYGEKLTEVKALYRNEDNQQELVDNIARLIGEYVSKTPDEVKKIGERAFHLAGDFIWDNMIAYYRQSFSLALQMADTRADQFKQKKAAEHLPIAPRRKVDPQWRKILIDPTVPERLSGLVKLSKNLWWSWNYDAIELFEVIDKELWYEVNNNPISLIEALPLDVLKSLEQNPEFLEKLDSVITNFDKYMADAENKKGGLVAYFSMEYGLHDTVKIFSGGLGMLAGDYLKEASDSNKNLIGVGLLYRYGYFTQEISIFGDQIAKSNSQKFSHMPLVPLRDTDGNWMMVSIAFPGRTMFAKVWRVDVGRIPLYLLDTDIPENYDIDKGVTHQLYGGDWENRLKQELLLGVGGIRMLEALKIKPDIYHLNEGHAAFIGVERLKDLVQREKLYFNQAVEIVRGSSLFTTHTPVPAGHDAFSEDLLRAYIPHYAERLNITWEAFMNLGRFNENDSNEKFSVSALAINLSQEVNGVSRIHGRVSREMFAPLFYGYFPDELYIDYVTNGVHFPTWTAKSWQKLYARVFGEAYIHDQSNPNYWKKIYDVADDEIWMERTRQKTQLIKYIKQRLNGDMTRRQENPKLIFRTLDSLRVEPLTIGFARRFATYKRAHLLFSNLERLSKIVNNPRYPVQFVFAGKAHPHDKAGQDLIKRIIEISKHPDFIGKVVFVENYDMELAKYLIHGVDVWLNTPTRPLEASGTSGEKAIMNGVVNFSVLDGWWAEGYKPGAGWALKEEQTYSNHQFQDELDAETIYSMLEDEIIPTYYDTNWNGVPTKWVAHIKNTIALISPHFTMKRQLDDYYEKFYNKLFERASMLKMNNYEAARNITVWKRRMLRFWDDIEVVQMKHPESMQAPFKQGDFFEAEIVLNPGELSIDEIGIEVLFGRKNNGSVEKILNKATMDSEVVDNNNVKFTCKVPISNAGVYDFVFRMYPKHELLPHRQDLRLVRWL
jgi:phosphorylase/glycogen(starch) synthase